jgi:hypothetical protein
MCINSLYGASQALVNLRIYDILLRGSRGRVGPLRTDTSDMTSGNTLTINNYTTHETLNETSIINNNITYLGKHIDKKA